MYRKKVLCLTINEGQSEYDKVGGNEQSQEAYICIGLCSLKGL